MEIDHRTGGGIPTGYGMMSRREHSVIKKMVRDYARRYHDSPGAAVLARLAGSSAAVSAGVLAELRDHMERVGVPLAGTLLAIRMRDVVFGFGNYADASAFTASVNRELARCLDIVDGAAMAGREIARRCGA
jgi:hypothetical protein